MAYSTGTVTITQGTYIVTGIGTRFLNNVKPNDIIYVEESSNFDKFYEILRVTSDVQLILNAAYSTSSVTSANYIILRDFTKNFGWPLVNNGSPNWPVTLSKSLEQIDNDICTMKAGKKIKFLQLTNLSVLPLTAVRTDGIFCYYHRETTSPFYRDAFIYSTTASAWKKLITVNI